MVFLPFNIQERYSVNIVLKALRVPDPVCVVAENLATTGGFDPRTVQPVVSRYTDYNIPTHFIPALRG